MDLRWIRQSLRDIGRGYAGGLRPSDFLAFCGLGSRVALALREQPFAVLSNPFGIGELRGLGMRPCLFGTALHPWPFLSASERKGNRILEIVYFCLLFPCFLVLVCGNTISDPATFASNWTLDLLVRRFRVRRAAFFRN